jgi:threonine/homoserine/homoserine lactone efflux protein
MLDAQLLAFVAVALVITLTPGPDMALVLRNTVRGGRSAGLETVAGIACCGPERRRPGSRR